ncbi:MAG: hypothetical protein L0213_12760 [Candidatus Dadabacteria bacterium]|nr:hypothetical protein [Candidatus Dadabacteria bacterium]
MDTLMLWRLAGAFINVTILSRGAHLLLRRWIPAPFKRAYLVLILVALLDFAGIWALYRDLATSFYIALFYYLPLLMLWFLKDILDASRMRGRASRGTE